MNVRVGDLFVESNPETGKTTTGIVVRIEGEIAIMKWADYSSHIRHNIEEMQSQWLVDNSNRPWVMKYYPVKK